MSTYNPSVNEQQTFASVFGESKEKYSVEDGTQLYFSIQDFLSDESKDTREDKMNKFYLGNSQKELLVFLTSELSDTIRYNPNELRFRLNEDKSNGISFLSHLSNYMSYGPIAYSQDKKQTVADINQKLAQGHGPSITELYKISDILGELNNQINDNHQYFTLVDAIYKDDMMSFHDTTHRKVEGILHSIQANGVEATITDYNNRYNQLLEDREKTKLNGKNPSITPVI